MKRNCSALGWLLTLVILCLLNPRVALGQATVTIPAGGAILATNVGGTETGTMNTQFIFRANITPSTGNFLRNLTEYGISSPGGVVIDPVDPANPEFGGARVIQMRNIPGTTLFVAYIPGYIIAPLGPGTHTWSILGADTSTGGTLMNGVNAAPKPAANVIVVNNQTIEILPVDETFQIDKRSVPGQLGGGLRVDPVDPTSPNDGGSGHFYTWRVRLRTTGGLPPQFMMRRNQYEWHDSRFDPGPLVTRYNSAVILVLIDPSGGRHFCPMEIDPDAPNGGITHAATYTTDTDNPNSLLHPTGNAQWNTGMYFRFRMLGAQYNFIWGQFPGEGPYTAFGGPTAPDLLPAIPIGGSLAAEIIGRPFTNQYVSFAGADRVPFAPPHPYYTNTAGRSGQWRYYYTASLDLRPPTRPGFPTNGSVNTYPNDLYGADIDAYLANFDSDNGTGPSSPNTPYGHPFVTPILSDGGWTDDLPENGYVGAQGNNSHRFRPTAKTRVRFQVRVTKADNNPLPAQAVQVIIDGTPFTMTLLPRPGNDDYIQGRVFYYDTTFASAGQTGRHWIYFLVDDGVHRAIWPRRDTPTQGTGDARFFDPQATLIRGPFPNSVNFGTVTVGKNFLDEPLVNTRPVLSGSSVTPPSGSEGQAFTYTITYTDADNDPPLDSFVIIDGQPHRMTQDPADNGRPFSTGRRYNFTMTLNQTPDNKHTYFFRFRDNWNNLVPYGISAIRTEAGEWATFPAGDDSGNPPFEINGPVIIGNNPSELTETGYFFSDPAQTPATLFDFFVRYKDADNQAPAAIKMYLSNDGGVTFDSGTGLVKAEASSNYVTGVQYHLPTRIQLPVGGPYVFKFESHDGVQTASTTLIHVGTRDTAAANGTAHELRLVSGNTVYGDSNGTTNLNSTKLWYPDPSTVYVWRRNGSTYTRLVYGVDFNVDFPNGLVNLAAPTSDRIYASYFYQNTVGPIVNPNNAPSLEAPSPGTPTTNDGTLTPLQGSPTTNFTYSIIYKDPDNQPPTFINVVIDTNNTQPMTIDPATPNPPDYVRGVRYNVTTTLGNGTHNYHFEASDGADTARFPLTTANPNQLEGPTVLDIGNLDPTSIYINPFPKGTSIDKYTFRVTYRNVQGDAPRFPIEVRLLAQGATTPTVYTLNPIDPIGPTEYMNGVRYETQLQAPSPLAPGSYEVTFGFQSAAAGTPPRTLIVNARPIISSPSVVPTPASQAGDIVFSVSYSDLNGDQPIRGGNRVIKLFIDGVEHTATNPAVIGSDFVAGVVYQWTIQAKDIPVGAHKYYFTAQDDLEDSVPAVIPALPGGDFQIVAAKIPVLQEPGGDATNNNGTLTPKTSAAQATYTYSVVYKHGDGVPPVTINVVIDPGTAGVRTVAMTPVNPNPTPADFINGVTYQAMVTNLTSGTHTYKFVASDRLQTVELPAVGNPPYNGPTVNFPGTLTLGTVFEVGATSKPTVNGSNQLVPPVKGNILSKFVFEITYTDQDFVGTTPPTVTVTINGSQTLTLSPKAGDPLNYTNGVVFTTDPAGIALGAGQKVFHFDASDGLDPARFPTAPNTDITGLTVANVPVLEPSASVSEPTLTPIAGPLSTTFTYRIVYKNADNTPPAYVRVVIDGTPYDMTKATAGTNYAAGVLYQYQYRFPSGTTHNYRFEAVDTVSVNYTAKYPADGSTINGPSINVPVFTVPTFNPPNPIVGQSVTATSQLVTNTPLGADIAIKLTRPDGTGIIDTARTDPATGVFTYTFTPNQTGEWGIQFSWSGSAGTYDPIAQDFTFIVKGISIPLNGGELDFIALPLVPTTPDPALTFGATSDQAGTTPVSVTVLNVIKWVPGLSRYLLLNQDGNFPGIMGGQGYWTRPSQTVYLNPRGRLVDQTQTYEIPLNPGWTMIGSVYLQDINWSAVKVRFNGQLLNLADAPNVVRSVAWGYNKATGGYEVVTGPNGVLRSGRGYWVRAFENCTLVLAPPGQRSPVEGRDAVERATSLQIVARMGNRMDRDNFAPLNAAGKSRLALMEKPPYLGDYVTVRFLPDEKVELPAGTRAAATGANVIAFEVETDRKNADVAIQFPNVSALGRRQEVTLVDLAGSRTQALGSNSGFTYNTGDNAKPRRFALLVENVTMGTRLIISNVQAKTRLGGMSFEYTISQAASMQVQVVNGSGQVVRDLDKGRAATRGVNSLVWDGKDDKGTSVSSGIYQLRLKAVDDQGRSANATLPVVIVR